jgi:hypothetical protein
VPAHDDVHLRLVEHVAHVQSSGDVGRREQQREDRSGFTRWRRRDGEQLFFYPVFGPAGLNGSGLVGFWKFVGHREPLALCGQLSAGRGGERLLS